MSERNHRPQSESLIKVSILGKKCTLFQQAKSPCYNLRVMIKGRRRQFSTGETTKALAIDKARAILADLKSRGLEESVNLHSRRLDHKPIDPNLGEFADLYRQAILSTDSPPQPQTQAFYLKKLNLIARLLRISRVRALTPEKIDEFKRLYIAKGLECGRAPARIRTSLNTILRNASSLFSQDALAWYAKAGIALANPFAGKLERSEIRSYTPMPREALALIVKNSALLRDGDLSAARPASNGKRWHEPDWRKPHPEAYVLLLLELGLGLRRNEADKAQWDWIRPDGRGGFQLQVDETAHFKPKSGHKRSIWLPAKLHQALEQFRATSPFIVAGNTPKTYAPGKEPANIPYRCAKAHFTLTSWLRRHGVADQKAGHTLRKEFGSIVATQFGLFAAQKTLGHSTPKITSDYYSSLVELPQTNVLDQISLSEIQPLKPIP